MGLVILLLLLLIGALASFGLGMLLVGNNRIKVFITIALLLGFVACIAMFQLIYIVFYLANAPKIWFLYSIGLIYSCLAMLGIVYFLDNTRFLSEIAAAIFKKMNIQVLLIFLFIALQIVAVTVLQHEDDDDASYIVNSTTFICSTTMQDTFPLTGTKIATEYYDTNQMGNYNRQGWDVLSGVLSEWSKVAPAVISHTVFPALLLIIHWTALYYLSICLFDTHKKRLLFSLFYTLLEIFGAFSAQSSSSFLFLRLWQGKAVLVNIFLLILYSYFLQVYKEEKRRLTIRNILVFTGLCYGGRTLSSIGIYFIPFALGILMILYAISRKSIIPLMQSLLCIFPNLIAAFQVKQEIMADGGIIEQAPFYFSIWKNYFGNSLILFAFVAAIILIAMKGEKRGKLLFSHYSMLILATYLNPIFYQIITEYIVGAPVFWRMLWLLPVQGAVAYAFIIMLDILPTKKLRYVFAAISITGIMSLGSFVFTDQNFMLAKNLFKISNEAIATDIFLLQHSENPRTMAPITIAPKLRQYTGNVIVINPRSIHRLYEDLQKLNSFLYEDGPLLQEDIKQVFWKYKVEYLVFEKLTVANRLADMGILELMGKIENYSIYRVLK